MNPVINDLYSHLGSHKEGFALQFAIQPRDDMTRGIAYRKWFTKIWVPFGEKVHKALDLHDYDPATFKLHAESDGWDEVQGVHWHNARRHGYDHVLIVKHDGSDRNYNRGMWIVGEEGEAMRPEVGRLGDILNTILTQQKAYMHVAKIDITEELIRPL